MPFVRGEHRSGPPNVPMACHTHSWCPRCGAVTSDNRQQPDEDCGSCSHHDSPLISRLYKELQQILDNYLWRDIMVRGETTYSRTNEPMRRALRCTWLTNMCWVYAVATAYHMQRMMEKINAEFGENSILAIEELEYSTHKYWNYRHWVFVIHTSEGPFVFDPTGKQFGPDWGSFQAWETYKADKVYEPLKYYRLGHNYSLVLSPFTLFDWQIAPIQLFRQSKIDKNTIDS